MYVSYKWLQEFVSFDYSPTELDHILTMLGIEVESINDCGKKYENFFTAKVLNREPHPNADKLTVCNVSLGNETKEVVCGAPNVAEGQNVVLGIAGAFVPQNGMKIEKREIRNVASDGMLCSQYELGLGDDKSGIWVLPEDAPVGVPLATYMNLDDIVFEISVTPNRADCLSHLGIAREIAAYAGKKVKMPAINLVERGSRIEENVKVIIEDKEKCPRYTARVVRNASIKESPDWLKNRLIILGMRPINPVVDVTNLVLLETGQPLHAFDLDKLEDNAIIVKTAKQGEKFTTLDGKERVLDGEMLMICDGKKPVAIGGVMGGENSEINIETKNILIESAFFQPLSIRRTSKLLGIQSEASYRFERGVDIDDVANASARAALLIAELTSGELDKGILDIYPVKHEKAKIKLRYKRARDIIGVNISNKEMIEFLAALQFGIVDKAEDYIIVDVPSWRVDILLEIDLIEEIARLYNYDNIEPQFTSTIDFSSEGVPDELIVPDLRNQIADYFVLNNFNQILTQNQTDTKTSNLFANEPIKISNPLGEELSVMRPSMLPQMFRTIERNIRVGNSDLRLFEIGKSFHYVVPSIDTFIRGITEKETLVVAISGKSHPVQWGIEYKGTDFYDIKGIFESFAHFFHFDSLELNSADDYSVFSKNSLGIIYFGKLIGRMGQVSDKVLKEYGIEQDVYLLELELKDLYETPKFLSKYKPVSPYPVVQRDIGFVVDKDLSAERITEEILKNGGELLKNVQIFDVYSGKSVDEGKKNVAFSLSFSSMDRTLVDEEVDKTIGSIVSSVEKYLGAILRKF